MNDEGGMEIPGKFMEFCNSMPTVPIIMGSERIYYSTSDFYQKEHGITEGWDRFRGNNHESIECPKLTFGGSVSFARHLGKPLSLELWVDLIHRLQASGLCVYAHNQSQWTIGWGPGHCCVQLDEKWNVWDVDFVPWGRP